MTDTPRYPYVHLDVPTDDAELVAYELWEAGALGIEERDTTTLDQGAGGADSVTLVVSLPDDDAAARVEALFGRYGARVQHVVGDAWRDAWKAYFKPTRIGSRLLLRPSWEEVSPAPHEVVLTVDPGAAFGSGIHETTRLVLHEIDGRVRGDERVLDAGCGSGILAVAALLLGARDAVCVDVDPLAVTVTGENAEYNGVAERVRASTTPVADVEGTFDLILANIQAWILAEMAGDLTARLAAGGTLVLSGILAGQEEELAESFASLGEPVITRENEWVALTYSRPA